ncbi:carbohydrate esterase family 4 protein [Pterulicium gracile]|uniref:Carbohydrate esterase family 4 protein n=1 Tax=Pterulicium gracile TaxID=1884261 RepID=A0A5C3QI63_9AGAR|nr:carbohydrate esterase family 4 protein [Pterula gracilis]
MLSSAVLISAALLSVVSAAPPSSGIAAPLAEVIVNCKVPKTVALTLDDGPYIYARNISDALTAAEAKATFFLAGNTWSCIYQDENIKTIQYLHEQGHQIGSHTWNHLDLSLLTRAEVNYEMNKTEEAILRVAGLKPAFMRPPFGRYNNLVREVVAERGQKIAFWDTDTEDSWGATIERSKETIDEAIARDATSLHILAHDTYATTAYELVPYAIKQLQGAGYKLVTLAECLGEEPYQWTQKPGVKNDTWRCG